MMLPLQHTHLLLRRLRRQWIFAVLRENVFLALALTACLLIICVLVDALLQVHPVLLRWYYVAAALAVLGAAARAWVMLRAAIARDEDIIRFAQQSVPALGDRLLSAWQLSRQEQSGISPALVERLATEVEAAVQSDALAALKPPAQSFRRYLAAAAAALVLLTGLWAVPATRAGVVRVLSSAVHASWQEWFTVTPGTASCPANSGSAITVTARRPLPGAPTLRILTGDGTWIPDAWTQVAGGSFTRSFSALPAAVVYRVEWNNFVSPAFTLTPVLPASAGSFEVTYIYPAYTGLPASTVAGDPNIAAPAGTEVRITARLSRPAVRAVLADDRGTRVEGAIHRTTVRWALRLTHAGTYKLLIATADGITDPEPPAYALRLVPDQEPTVRIESPSADLVAAPAEEVPLIIAAADDYGLARMNLCVKPDGGQAETLRLPLAAKPGSAATVEYRLPLARYHLRPGQKLAYYAEAWDNDAVAGSKKAVTPAQSIEIADFTSEHDAIEQEIQRVRDQLLAVLADQTAAREALSAVQVQYSTAAARAALQAQQGALQSMDAPVRSLARLLDRMAADPYTNPAAAAEYRGIAAQSSYLRETRMPAAAAALERSDYTAAAQEEDEIIAALEKITLLAEDVSKFQRMRDVCEAGDQLSAVGTQLLGPVASAAEAAELQKTLDQINQLLADIQQKLGKLPQELPEDFVNAPAVKSLNPGSAQSLADQARAALERGDYAAATAKAKELYQQLQEMAKTISAAAQEAGYQPAATKEHASALSGLAERLDRIAQEESSIIERAEKIDRTRKEAVNTAQEKHFAGLATRQEEQVRAAEALRQRLDAPSPELSLPARETTALMRKVYDEFTTGRVYHAQKFLEDIVAQWKAFGARLEEKKKILPESFVAEVRTTSAGIQQAEAAILADLRKPAAAEAVSAGDAGNLRKLGAEQRKLADETQSLKKSIDAFARSSSLVPPEAAASVGAAATEMRHAANQMESLQPSEGLESARRALEHLGGSGNGMQAAGQAMGETGKTRGEGPAIRLKSGGSGFGFRPEPVRIPTKEEYTVPAAFRQEILDALKEKYPHQYERVIREYYRRITR